MMVERDELDVWIFILFLLNKFWFLLVAKPGTTEFCKILNLCDPKEFQEKDCQFSDDISCSLGVLP